MQLEDALSAACNAVQTMLDAEALSGDDLARPTPCTSFNVDQLMGHIRDTHVLLTSAAVGDPIANRGSMPDCHSDLVAAAQSAWESRGREGTVNVGGHDLPASFALALHVVETLVHGWDLAVALGRDLILPDYVVELTWQVIPDIASDDARGEDGDAAYGPVVRVHPAATALERLVAFTGRDPHWGTRLSMSA